MQYHLGFCKTTRMFLKQSCTDMRQMEHITCSLLGFVKERRLSAQWLGTVCHTSQDMLLGLTAFALLCAFYMCQKRLVTNHGKLPAGHWTVRRSLKLKRAIPATPFYWFSLYSNANSNLSLLCSASLLLSMTWKLHCWKTLPFHEDSVEVGSLTAPSCGSSAVSAIIHLETWTISTYLGQGTATLGPN